MALNIPVNLMNTVSQPNQHSISTETAGGIAAIKPASRSADMRNTASGGDGNKGSAEQNLPDAKRRALAADNAKSDRAEPGSVVVAQATPRDEADKARTTNRTALDEPPLTRASELDRYAPPDPLPTAPILKAVSAYKLKPETL